MEVIHSEEFAAWFLELDAASAKDVDHVVGLLAALGVRLGFPHSSAINDAPFALRELRPCAGRSPLRVLYAFDPLRNAVLLVGGDKSSDKKFYRRMTKKAVGVWNEYLLRVEEKKTEG